MGLFVQCLYALSLHLVAVVCGNAIPTSLNIFGKCFIYLYIYIERERDLNMARDLNAFMLETPTHYIMYL